MLAVITTQEKTNSAPAKKRIRSRIVLARLYAIDAKTTYRTRPASLAANHGVVTGLRFSHQASARPLARNSVSMTWGSVRVRRCRTRAEPRIIQAQRKTNPARLTPARVMWTSLSDAYSNGLRNTEQARQFFARLYDVFQAVLVQCLQERL